MKLGRYFIGFLQLFSTVAGSAHPVDTSGNSRIEARELAAYSSTAPSADLFQQAINIYQLGRNGAYEAVSFGVRSICRPLNPDYQFVTLGSYAAAPLSRVEVAAIPTSYVAYFFLSSNLAKNYRLELKADQVHLRYSVEVPQGMSSPFVVDSGYHGSGRVVALSEGGNIRKSDGNMSWVVTGEPPVSFWFEVVAADTPATVEIRDFTFSFSD